MVTPTPMPMPTLARTSPPSAPPKRSRQWNATSRWVCCRGVACVATAALWIASGWFAVTYRSASGWMIGLGAGCLGGTWGTGAWWSNPSMGWDADGFEFDMLPWGMWGVDRAGVLSVALAPLWPLALALAAASLLLLFRRDRRQNGIGHCQACGYDLRGNPAATVCAECGVGIVVSRA